MQTVSPPLGLSLGLILTHRESLRSGGEPRTYHFRPAAQLGVTGYISVLDAPVLLGV